MHNLLTSNDHHTNRKYFFRISVWRNVSKTNACETTKGKIDSRNVASGETRINTRGIKLLYPA